jgi:predicted ATPase/DNA-binding winged helix-turn-helix (wHTH) protein
MTATASNDPGVAFGQFRLFRARHLLLEGDTPVRLGSRARDLLTALLEQPGQAVSKEALCARIWPNVVVEEGTLRAQVAVLRKALRDGQNGRRYIANIAGRGYAFVGQLSAATAQAPVAAELPETAAPLPTARLFGRTDVIETLRQRFAEHRLVTIVGPGGIGKTSTALALADRLRPGLRDGVCFVDLAPLADERLVSSVLASALGAGVVSDDPLPSLAAMLRDRDMLIVLDNCEHVIDSTAFLAETIARKTGARLRILATSREALGIEGEQVFRLAPLALPEPGEELTAAAAMAYPAVQLFVERAAMSLGEYALTDAHAPAVARICRQLDGIALAIEIAAGQVDALGVTGLARMLDDRFRLAMQGRRTGLPRHRTMSTALDWSYQLLPEVERAALRRLAVFAGLFTISEAVGLLPAKAAEPSAAEYIANLVTKSLIVPNFETPVPTYRLLETTRAYALQMLEESGERTTYMRRHAQQCLVAMEAANLSWEGSAQEVWLAKYRHLIDDIRAALDPARSDDAETAVALTAAAVPLWYQLSLLNECYERSCRALELTTTSRDTPRKLRLHAAKAWSLMQIKGFVRETEDAWTAVLSQSRENGSIEYQLRGLWGLWATRVNAGELRASLDIAKEFLSLAQGQSQETSELDRCVGHRMIGHSLHLLGDQAQARHHLERMLASYTPPAAGAQAMRYVFNQRTLARSFLARILWLQGFPDQAREMAWDLVREEQKRGDALSLCQVLVQAGCPVGLIVGELDVVDGFVTELVARAERNEWHFWRMFGACFRSVVTVQRGDVEAGLPMLEEALAGLRSIDHGVHYLFFLCEHAKALGLAGRIDRALAAIDEAIARSEKNEERWCIAEALRIKGSLLSRRGDLEGAAREYALSRQWAERQGALSWVLRTAISAARLARDRKQSAAARADLVAVLDRFTEGHDTVDYRRALAMIDRLGGRGA